MKFTPFKEFNEILNDKILSTIDKLFLIYAQYLYIHNNGIKNDYSNKLLEALITKNSVDTYETLMKTGDYYPTELTAQINQIIKQPQAEDCNNINQTHILKKSDFIDFADKSLFGGLQDGSIAINKKNGKLYFLKTHRTGDVKSQDEYYLNNLNKIIAPKYVPYKTHLLDNGQTAISYVPKTYDLLNKIMELGGGTTNFTDLDKSIEVVDKGIKKYFEEELKDKKSMV